MTKTFERPRAVPLLTFLWGSWLAVVLMLALVESALNGSPRVFGNLAVLTHAILAALIVLNALPARVAIALVTSLFLRVGLVFWDIAFSRDHPLPFSGVDTEAFYVSAISVADDPSLVLQQHPGGTFAKVFGILFYLIGPQRGFAQYTNVAISITVIVLIYRVICSMQVDAKLATNLILLAAFFPTGLFLSAIFLRESLIALFVAISVAYFIKWFFHGGVSSVVLTFGSLFLASTLHAAVISIGFAYIGVILVRQRRAKRFSLSGLLYFGAFVAIFYVVWQQYPDIFLGKFDRFESETDVVEAVNRRDGGAAYLADLSVNSLGEFVVYGPIRAFYFIASPLPWDFRGVSDAVGFLTDGLFYLAALAAFVSRRLRLDRESYLLGISLVLAVIVSTLVFGSGVSNSGTAMRHRFKLFSIFLLLGAVAAKTQIQSALGGSGRRDRHKVDSSNNGLSRK